MNGEYIAPAGALKKLKTARSLLQTVYICGATGFGKTELVRQYFVNRNYLYLTCEDNLWNADVLPQAGQAPNTQSIVVIDDLQWLQRDDEQQRILTLAGQKEVWLVLIGRSSIPQWLMPCYINGSLMVIDEDDLKLTETDIGQYMKTLQMELTAEQLHYFWKISQGNAYIVRQAALYMKKGEKLNKGFAQKMEIVFADYLENHILIQWDSDLLEFLMQVSVVDEFTLELAEMITGNYRVKALIDKAQTVGNFLFREDTVYCLRPVMLKALRSHAVKVYGTDKIKQYAYHAGMYYSMNEAIIPALNMFEYSGHRECIRELLIHNARCNPGIGHYYELRRYYFALSEQDIENNVVLMAAMSMLYSLLMNAEQSEYWYDRLKVYAGTASGGRKREAQSYISYLDIGLPHRGTAGMIDIVKSIPNLLFNKDIGLPEFSVTSNMPSTMNGGKDFCGWSLCDRELAASIGKLVERILGRHGHGLGHVALGESLYEKGDDTFEIMSHLTRAQLQTEGGGTLEIAFASVGLQIRLNLLYGNDCAAKDLLDSFERKVREQEQRQLLPNIAALRCRLALYEGDKDAVRQWMQQAPDENREFCVLERYRYMTKVRCYLFAGEYMKAQFLLEKMRYYAEFAYRTYIRMEAGVLSAVAKYRMGTIWKPDLLAALREAGRYRFLRLISEEGAAVYELLEAAEKDCLADKRIDNDWFKRLLNETGGMAVRYPAYLKKQLVDAPAISGNALMVLRMQANGMTIAQIAKRLGIKQETVKYHCRENYRKLGVSGKTEAVQMARNLRIL